MVLVPGKRKHPHRCNKIPISLLMQLMGILHLSAVCARAMAVAGAGLSPSTTAAATASGCGGTVASRAAAAVVSPSATTAAEKSFTAVAATKHGQAAPKTFVSGSSNPGTDERAQRQPALRKKPVPPAVSCWDRRATKVSHTRRTPCEATVAFVPPLGGGVRRSRCWSRLPISRPSSIPCDVVSAVRIGLCAAPFRKRDLSMNAAAAAVAAAEAMASLAGRVSRARPSLIDLRAFAAGTAGGIEPDDSGDRNRANGGGSASSADSTAFSPIGALQALLSLLRLVLTGGRVRQQTTAVAATKGASWTVRRREGLQFFFHLFQWMWWPFAGLEGSINRRYKRPQATAIPKQRAMLQPPSAQKVQYWYPRPQSTAYPRPQSTAYPRPQSTAYPRPKVTTPSLLNLEVEDRVETLPPRKKRLALAAAGNEAASRQPATRDPLWSKFLVWFFEWVITSRAKVVEGLEVNVDARSNREAMSGLLQSVGITFNHLELENLQISGGARMCITGLDLKVMTLLWKRFGSFKKPFEVEGSYVLTSEDLATSSMVRRLVTNMMNSTLRKLEALATDPLRKSSITVNQVTAKRSRLVIEGEMAYDSAKVPFTYRTSIGVRGKGHVVYLKDPEVFWENVGGSLSLPLLPLETFDVDMGEGARIESIRIVNGQVALKARVVISPFPPLLVASLRKRAAISYDVAERLSVTFGNLVQNMKILRLQVRPN